ncbi:seminase-like [Lucilia sericata]|uniref:seminase-like n=1 Tax=Lucilia sericata TaxID=13632 RepID=UPI0018A81FD9|nr:seminase-like [Lucilia sericata]
MEILTVLYSLILALVLQTNALFLKISEQSARIVNGNGTTIDKAKYVVNLRIGDSFICGGSLVAPKIVLTAAHCVDWYSAAELSIVGGATYRTEKGIKRSVSSIHIPNEYNRPTMNMDIAVLVLSKPMKGANISTIELCKTNCNAGDELSVYGWGQIDEDNETNQLRTVNVPVVEQKKCRDMFEGDIEITNAMLCAGDLMGKGACFGDSGGPAVFNDQVCGVVSWGSDCAHKDLPHVYANVMYAREFIDEIMNKYESY